MSILPPFLGLFGLLYGALLGHQYGGWVGGMAGSLAAAVVGAFIGAVPRRLSYRRERQRLACTQRKIADRRTS